MFPANFKKTGNIRILTGILTFAVVFLVGINSNFAVAAEGMEVPISGVWYMSYLAGKDGGADVNKFYVHRGYLNFKPKFSSSLSARITPDITHDSTGDVKVRLKYMYMNFNLPSNDYFTKSYVEFGLVHRPWLDFEEHIDNYRMQGTMYLERSHLFNSADFGVTFVTLLGGEVDEDYQKNISSKYPGRYGSVALGLYNGGGYHAHEKNINKVFEGRFTLRPMPDHLPGLQLSYFGIFGKGNIAAEPDWKVNTFFLSYEDERFVATGTYYNGKGDSKGKMLDGLGNPYDQSGFSLFGEVNIPESKFSLIGRYDSFDPNTSVNDNLVNRRILGVVYKFAGKHKALLDFDFAEDQNGDVELNKLTKFTIEVHF
ncbi:hypothetical protein ACFL7D_01485 [candidate division KSB1 bacterium]